MSKLPFMPWYPADYKADTGHLTLEEEGAYRRLIDELWMAEGQLVFDEARLARRLGVTPKRFARIWSIIGEFFALERGFIRHKRVDSEIAKARDLVEKRSLAGKRAAQKKKEKTKKNNGRVQANVVQTSTISEPDGSGTPLRGTENHQRKPENEATAAAVSAPARESGGGLSALPKEWLTIKRECTLSPLVSLMEMDAFTKAITSTEGNVIRFKPEGQPERVSTIVADCAAKHGYEVKPVAEQPKLKAINGGKNDQQ